MKKVWFFLTFLLIVCIILWGRFLLFFIQKMKKNLLLKVWLVVLSLWLICPLFTSATVFHLTGLEKVYALSKEKMEDNMMYIHFADNWNDFGGFMYFSDWIWGDSSSSGAEIKTDFNDQTYVCRRKVRWFYYNAERWERLWPLDNETWKGLTGLEWLITSWWIYTICAQSWYDEALKRCEYGTYEDCPLCDYNLCVETARLKFGTDWYGYYGSLDQEYSWQKYNLTMWVRYDINNKFISIESGSKLAWTFARLNNKFPVWFIYDTKGWIGLAWCKCDDPVSPDSMKKLVEEVQSGWLASVFSPNSDWTGVEYNGSVPWISCNNISLEDMLLKIVIEWIMWVSNGGVEGSTKFWALGNTSDTKMQYFGTKNITNTTMMNYAKKRAEQLCRWKWMHNGSTSDEIICWDWGSIDNWTGAIGKTLIVKEGNVKIRPMDNNDINGNKYYDILILSGNLLIEETNDKFVIDSNGFMTGTNTGDFYLSAIALGNGMDSVSELIDQLSGCINAISGACNSSYPEGCDWKNHEECKYWMNLNNDEDELINSADMIILENYDNAGKDISNVSSVASVIKWNFIVNWYVKSADEGVLGNKYFIYGKFTTKDTFNSLENVFSWRCNSQMGSDAFPCPKIGPYRNASLVVIDQNYVSPLLQS